MPQRSLKDLAQSKISSGNATQLGDPISLKAETSSTTPTDQDKGAAANPVSSSGQPGVPASKEGMGNEKKSLKDLAESKLSKGNPTMLGDPVSLKAETADSEPTDGDRGALDKEGKRKVGSKL